MSVAPALLAAESVDFPVLTALIVTPAIGALVLALVPNARADLFRLVALLFSGVTGAMTVWLLVAFDQGDGGFQFVENEWEWSDTLGVGWN